jgi:hypothetical protein
VGGGPAKVDQITSVTVTDEPVADAPSPPDPNELVERAQALIGMGITDMVEIKELITGMHAEEARSRVIVIADTLVFRFNELQIASSACRRVRQIVRDPAACDISQTRPGSDAETPGRGLGDATAEELAGLMLAYSHRPEPYSQGFYRQPTAARELPARAGSRNGSRCTKN